MTCRVELPRYLTPGVVRLSRTCAAPSRVTEDGRLGMKGGPGKPKSVHVRHRMELAPRQRSREGATEQIPYGARLDVAKALGHRLERQDAAPDHATIDRRCPYRPRVGDLRSIQRRKRARTEQDHEALALPIIVHDAPTSQDGPRIRAGGVAESHASHSLLGWSARVGGTGKQEGTTVHLVVCLVWIAP